MPAGARRRPALCWPRALQQQLPCSPRRSAEFDQSGPLADLLVEEGSTAEISRQLATMPELAGVQVAVPLAGAARPITIA